MYFFMTNIVIKVFLFVCINVDSIWGVGDNPHLGIIVALAITTCTIVICTKEIINAFKDKKM